jgi:glycosyltransferase involved in cell wall biosynthesis
LNVEGIWQVNIILRNARESKFMDVVFYSEPRMAENGPNGVVWHLSRELEKRLHMTYIPPLISKRALNLANVYTKFLSQKIDIVHYGVVPSWFNGTYFLLDMANRRKIPTVLNIHGLIEVENAYEPSRFVGFSRMHCFNCCRLADKVVANSDYMKTKMAYLYKIDPNKIAVIPNGINFNAFSSCKSEIKLDGDPAILSVSRVCMLKGFGTMVEAVSKVKEELPHIKLHLVGYASKEYIEFVKSKGLDKYIIFHGRVPHTQIPPFLKSADFGIYGSILYEGFGISLVEAMASGLPIIASDIDTYRQIVNNEKDGLLFKRSNDASLSEAILALSTDLTLRKRLSHNSQITAARYDWGKVAGEYISLYNDLCS